MDGSPSGTLTKTDLPGLIKGAVVAIVAATVLQLGLLLKNTDFVTALGLYGPAIAAVGMVLLNAINEFVRAGVYDREAWGKFAKSLWIAGFGALATYLQNWIAGSDFGGAGSVVFWSVLGNLFRKYISNDKTIVVPNNGKDAS